MRIALRTARRLPLRWVLTLAALAGLAPGAAHAQDFVAAHSFGPAVLAAAATSDGGWVAGGYCPDASPCDFDPSVGTVSLRGGTGGRDGWVARFDRNGSLLWLRNLAAAGPESLVAAVVLDVTGAVYLTGYSVNSPSGRRPFVWKLSPAGDLVWARMLSGSGNGEGRGIAVDRDGKVWVTGSFLWTVDFDPGAGMFPLTSAGMEDVFVLALDPAGELVTAVSFGSTSIDEAYGGIALDSAGRPVVTGAFHGTVDFDPGAGSAELTGNGDPFILALDTDASLRWARHLAGGDFWDIAYATAITSDDGVVVAGSFRGTLDLDPGPEAAVVTSPHRSNGFIVRLDADGKYAWGGGLVGSSTTGGAGSSQLSNLAIGPAGDVYLTGTFRNVVDFDTGAGLFTMCSTSYGDDPFVLALGPRGVFRWVGALGGYGSEYVTRTIVTTPPAAANEIVTFGDFSTPGDYDPGVGTFTLTPSGHETFVSRLTDVFALPTLRRVPTDFPTVQQAIDGSRHRDTIVVGPGTYVENLDFRGQHVVLRSEAGPAATILDGAGVGPVVTFRNGEDQTTVLEGFTIRNGWAGGGPVGSEGGGIRIAGDASPTIRGNVITGNLAGGAGAGIVVRTGRPVIERNEIRGNAQIPDWSGGGGGGIAVIFAAPLIQDNVIAGNRWNQYGRGGGISVYAGSTFIERNRIYDNEALDVGGGVSINGDLTVLAHNLVYGNRSSKGGAIYAAVGGPNSVYLLNNTVADNVSARGSAVFFEHSGPATVANNVLTSRPGDGPTVECGSPSTPPMFVNNDVWAGGSGSEFAGGCTNPGGSNLTADPLYRDPTTGNYHVDPASPVVDHGHNGWVLASAAGPEWDLDRRPRRVDEPGTPDTGAGAPPLVDAGAYESNPEFLRDGFESGDLLLWAAHAPLGA